MVNNHRLRRIIINGLFVTVSCLIIGMVIYYFVSQALVRNVEESLIEIAKQGAKIVEGEVKGNFEVLEAVANIEQLKNEKISLDEKLRLLDIEVKRKGLKRISIADINGNAKTTDGSILSISDREYFKKAANGQRNVSDPIVSRVDGTLVVTFAIPVYTQDKKITAVLYATHDVESICKITDDITMGEEGESLIVNRSGIIVAHHNRNIVRSMENIIKKSQKDSELKPFAKLVEQMIAGKVGAGEYIYDGMKRYMGFSPIKGTDWSIAVTAPKSQIFRNINITIQLIVTLAILLLMFFSLISLYASYLKKKLREEKIVSNTAIDTAHIIVITLDTNGIILSFNKYAEIITGLDEKDIIGKVKLSNLVPEVEKERVSLLMEKLKKDDDISNLEIPIFSKDRSIIYVLWSYNKEKKLLGDSDNYELMGIDITERAEFEKKLLASNEELAASKEELKLKYDELFESKEKLLKSEERFRLSAEGSNDILWEWDLKNKKATFSERWFEALGYNAGEIGTGLEDWNCLVHPDDIESIYKTVERHIRGEIPNFSCEYRLRTKSGFYKWFFARGKARLSENSDFIKMAGSLTDVTQQKEYEQNILKLAYFDTLTGLPNRSRLIEKFEICKLEALEKVALLFVDIDNFKFINDSYGHSMGDRVIIETVKILENAISENDTLSRQSGDEFNILLTGVKSKEDIIITAEKILKSFDKTFEFEDIIFNLSVSIGIAVYPEDGSSFEDLSKNADTALYKAKDMGKKNYIFFEKSMNDAIMERIVLESNLRKAIENEEFILHYQPQVNIITGKIVGFEALIRWISPALGFISPAKFIYVAEESGLIVPIGKWVLKTACRFIKKLVVEGNRGLKVSVNISVMQLMQDDFVDIVMSTLEQVGLEPEFLDIEITETILMESIDSNLRKLEQLRDKGIKVSLDDFGKGYSSLTYLKQLPIDTLKIDKAFVDDISNDKGITESIVMIANKLGLNVVAEGVETKEQLDYLTKSSCNIIQGYLISKPIPEHEAASIIKKDIDI